MQNSLYKKFLRNYYLTGFFDDFVFAYAIYNFFFKFNKLSIFQISLLLGWWTLNTLILEIPTGALADRWSRKKMLVLAPIFKSGCFLIWFFANGDFYLYALGFTFWAASESLVSGTTQALLYDHLKYFNRSKEYEKILGKKAFYSHVALAISLISGGFIAAYSLDLTIILSIIPLLLSALFAALIEEVLKQKSTEEIRYLEYIKIAFKEIKTNKILPYLFAYYNIIFITFGLLDEFDQLYFDLVKLPIFAFGIAGFMRSSFSAIGSYYAYLLKDKTWIYYLFPFLCAICLAIVASLPSVYIIILLFISFLLAAPLHVLMESKIQHNIKSISRATVTSINAFFLNLLGVLLAPIFGLISKIWNLQAIYLTVAIIQFIFTFWVFIVRNRFTEKRLICKLDKSNLS
jgi:MFS family permease